MRKIVTGFLVLIFCFHSIKAQQGFYDLSTIQKIEINFSQPNWDYQMDTAKIGSDDYIMADWVKINGVLFDSVGVKYKGNSSYDSTYIKNPLHIELDAFTDQDYQGFADVKLGNGYADPSMIREVLSYSILGNYMHCPRSNFAQVYINGDYVGIYSNEESISKRFCASHFGSSKNNFIKCNPIVIPGPNTKSNLKYINADSSSYFNYYELKSKKGWNNLVALCDTVTNQPSGIESVMDVDRVIWMLAFNNVLVNLDSYTGVFAQNYYLYKDDNGRFNPVIWDLNMCLGGFPFVGSGNSSLAGLTVANMQQLPIGIHSTEPYWPLIKAVINNPQFKRMYVAHMRTIVNEVFANNSYQTLAAQLHAVADTALQSDPNKFYTYTQFQNGLTTDYPVGSYTVPGINNLMNARVVYLQSTPEFTSVPPTINNVLATIVPSSTDTVINVSAHIENSNTIYLGYRFTTEHKFIKIPMYDDGLHNDGNANDSVFGASINLDTIQCEYYIYAENNDAGIFSPERAEHEFYYIQVNIPVAVAGQVVINEVLSSNQNGVFDEFDKRQDWIELYNTTDTLLNLYGLYLTDTVDVLNKYEIPRNTFINPKSYLIFWADGDSVEENDFHMPFKLSSGGETVIFSDNAGAVLDQVTFGTQRDDISYGRCPDGSGSFTTLLYPSYNTTNCSNDSISRVSQLAALSIYPNPSDNSLTLHTDYDSTESFDIINAMGEIVYQNQLNKSITINTYGWTNGFYVIRMGNVIKKLAVIHPQK